MKQTFIVPVVLKGQLVILLLHILVDGVDTLGKYGLLVKGSDMLLNDARLRLQP